MANVGTITASNSVLMLGVTGLTGYTTSSRMQGYMADAAFASEEVDLAEVVLGVDGYMAAGYIPHLNVQTISLQAGTKSENMFELWRSTQDATQELLLAFGTLQIPSTGKKYTLSNGVLTRMPLHSEARRVLQGRAFRITWGSITYASL